MTDRQIIEGNKLIADFMGHEYIPFNNPDKKQPGWWKKVLKFNVIKFRNPRTNPISQEYFEIIKDYIVDEFCGGMEPEFETKEQWENWENLNSDHYKYKTEEECKEFSSFSNRYFVREKSPYQDNTIPFLHYIK